MKIIIVIIMGMKTNCCYNVAFHWALKKFEYIPTFILMPSRIHCSYFTLLSFSLFISHSIRNNLFPYFNAVKDLAIFQYLSIKALLKSPTRTCCIDIIEDAESTGNISVVG